MPRPLSTTLQCVVRLSASRAFCATFFGCAVFVAEPFFHFGFFLHSRKVHLISCTGTAIQRHHWIDIIHTEKERDTHILMTNFRRAKNSTWKIQTRNVCIYRHWERDMKRKVEQENEIKIRAQWMRVATNGTAQNRAHTLSAWKTKQLDTAATNTQRNYIIMNKFQKFVTIRSTRRELHGYVKQRPNEMHRTVAMDQRIEV